MVTMAATAELRMASSLEASAAAFRGFFGMIQTEYIADIASLASERSSPVVLVGKKQRDIAMPQERIGYAAEDQLPYSGMCIATHDDQIDSRMFGILPKRLGHVAVASENG